MILVTYGWPPFIIRWRCEYDSMTYYGLVDVFSPGLLSSMWNLGQIGLCKIKLQQLLVLCRNIKFATPSWQHCLMKTTIFTIKYHQGLRSFCSHLAQRSTSKYKTGDFLLPVGGTLTLTQYLHVDVFRRGLLPHLKFGAWSMFIGVINYCLFRCKKKCLKNEWGFGVLHEPPNLHTSRWYILCTNSPGGPMEPFCYTQAHNP